MLDGKKTARNKAEATHWLVSAVEQGYDDAAVLLAGLDGKIKATEIDAAEKAFNSGDYTKAATLWHQRADNGDVDAQSSLAWLYEVGLGVERNLKEAARMFRLAAKAGDVQAQYALAVMLKTGSGVEQDQEQSLMWLKKAAQRGHGPSISALKEFSNN